MVVVQENDVIINKSVIEIKLHWGMLSPGACKLAGCGRLVETKTKAITFGFWCFIFLYFVLQWDKLSIIGKSIRCKLVKGSHGVMGCVSVWEDRAGETPELLLQFLSSKRQIDPTSILHVQR